MRERIRIPRGVTAGQGWAMTATAAPARRHMAAPALHVLEAGAGEPLVLLHGLASSSRYWEPHLRRLGRTHHVIAPDLLGFGLSPRPRGAVYTPGEHLAALGAAIERRVDGPLTLVGHSMGAILALHLATRRPELVSRLVLLSLPAIGERAFGHTIDGGMNRYHRATVHTRLGQQFFEGGMRAVRPLWFAVAPSLRRDLPRGAAQDSMRTSWVAYWNSLENVVYGSPVRHLFHDVPLAPAVIHGAKDRVVPVGPVRDLMHTRTDVQYIELAEARHNPAWSHRAVFYAVLEGRDPAAVLNPASLPG